MGHGGGKMSLTCGGGGGVPCIVEMLKNLKEARGAPEQLMAQHE